MSEHKQPQLIDGKKSFWQRSLDKCAEVAKAAGKAADNAAEVTAKKCSEWTGRKITKDQVKVATAIAGVIALGMMSNTQGVQAMAAQGGSSSSNGEYFEDKVSRFCAENGVSLNYETPYVDCEGQIYY
ncbi:MAG: hypothetical protein ACFCD0_22985 [Gemmataceae bacterium]